MLYPFDAERMLKSISSSFPEALHHGRGEFSRKHRICWNVTTLASIWATLRDERLKLRKRIRHVLTTLDFTRPTRSHNRESCGTLARKYGGTDRFASLVPKQGIAELIHTLTSHLIDHRRYPCTQTRERKGPARAAVNQEGRIGF